MTDNKKTNYFYIDETGSISNDSNIFVHGCIKTDSPDTISKALLKLKNELTDSLYYSAFSHKIKKQGFHATENNMDMRADFYKLLPLLDYRSYFVVLNKKTDYFNQLKKTHQEHEIFAHTLKKLLHDRIQRNKDAKNIFVFEQIQIAKKSLDKILTDLFSEYPYDCEYKIVGKDEENMGVIDYLNFIFNHISEEILKGEKPMPRMIQNFELVAPKIGVIHFLNNGVYLSRKKSEKHRVNYINLINEIGGSSE